MKNETLIIFGFGLIIGAILFLIVYYSDGKAEYCVTPIGPCTRGSK